MTSIVTERQERLIADIRFQVLTPEDEKRAIFKRFNEPPKKLFSEIADYSPNEDSGEHSTRLHRSEIIQIQLNGKHNSSMILTEESLGQFEIARKAVLHSGVDSKIVKKVVLVPGKIANIIT